MSADVGKAVKKVQARRDDFYLDRSIKIGSQSARDEMVAGQSHLEAQSQFVSVYRSAVYLGPFSLCL